MGKGDKKSKRGKIFSGSYGRTRKRKTSKKKVFFKPAVKNEVPLKTKAPKEVIKEEVNIVVEEAVIESNPVDIPVEAADVAETPKKAKTKAPKKETEKKAEKKEPAKKKTAKKDEE